MPKNKVNTLIEIGSRRLADAKTTGGELGFTGEYINRLAAKNLIPWHGVKNGVKVYRRFDIEEVKAALAHPVQEPTIPKPQPVPIQKTSRAKTA